MRSRFPDRSGPAGGSSARRSFSVAASRARIRRFVREGRPGSARSTRRSPTGSSSNGPRGRAPRAGCFRCRRVWRRIASCVSAPSPAPANRIASAEQRAWQDVRLSTCRRRLSRRVRWHAGDAPPPDNPSDAKVCACKSVTISVVGVLGSPNRLRRSAAWACLLLTFWSLVASSSLHTCFHLCEDGACHDVGSRSLPALAPSVEPGHEDEEACLACELMRSLQTASASRPAALVAPTVRSSVSYPSVTGAGSPIPGEPSVRGPPCS